MKKEDMQSKRGFTAPEKWIIWGVFCLLLGLSLHSFAVFFGLMLLSAGISLFTKKKKVGLAITLSALGALGLAYSSHLL